LHCDIEYVAGYTPGAVGDSDQWSSIVIAAEENRRNFCKALDGKTLYNALYGTYTVALQEINALLKASATTNPTPKPTSTQEDGFTEVRRRNRQSSDMPPKLKTMLHQRQHLPSQRPPQGCNMKFLRPTEDNNHGHQKFRLGVHPTRRDGPGENVQSTRHHSNNKANLIQLQKRLKNVAKEDFEFRNTRSGTRVITRSMADFLAVKSRFEGNNLSFFTFYHKSEKPIKAVIRHLPINTPCRGHL
jgi:hypothetical protein